MRNDLSTKNIGSIGKDLVKGLFLRKGYDVTISEGAPTDYIDFTVDNAANHYDVFVRTDTRVKATGNIMVERFMYRADTDSIERGWLFDGKATLLCYLDADEGNLFFLDWTRLRKYVVEHCRVRRFRNSVDTDTVGDAYFIPVRELDKTGSLIGRTKINVDPLLSCGFTRPVPF